MSMTIVWGAAAVIFLVIEAATVGLASIWFALGALCALIAAVLGAALWLQIVWFVLISAATLAITRPLAKKYVNGKKQPTNADRVLGATVPVTERIDNMAGTGAVSADGKIWTARTGGGSTIEKGTLVRVLDIQGVKLIVEKAEEEKTE